MSEKVQVLLDSAAALPEAQLRGKKVPWYVDLTAVAVILAVSLGLAFITGGSDEKGGSVMGGATTAGGADPASEPYAPVDAKSAAFLALAEKLMGEGKTLKPEEVQFYRTPEPEMPMFKYRWQTAGADRVWEGYLDHKEKWVFNEARKAMAAEPTENTLAASSLFSWFHNK